MTLHDPETDRLFDMPRRKQRSDFGKTRGKTHCPHGHELKGDNLKVTGRYRQCRECCRKRAREAMQRQRLRQRAASSLDF